MTKQIVQDYLKKYGVLSSSSLKKLMIQEHGLTSVNAAQIISRALRVTKEKSGIDVMKNILPKRTGLLFISKEKNTEKFWKGVVREMQKSKGAYSYALNSIIARSGIVPIKHFHISCGSPPGKLKKHPSSVIVLKKLVDVNFVTTQDIPGLGECVVLNQAIGIKIDVPTLWLRLKLEELILDCVALWLKNLNLSAYNQLKSRKDSDYVPIYVFSWDLSGISYLNALRKNEKGSTKPGFVVVDLLMTKSVLGLIDIQPFIAKCNALRVHTNKKSVGLLEIFLTFKYDKEAFGELKKMGIMPATISNIFGEQLASSLFDTLDMLTGMGELDLEKTDTLLSELSRIEGPALNIRGTMFTLIVGHILTREGWKIISYDRVIKHGGKSQEVDIIAERGEEILYVECKGKQPQNLVEEEEVNKWSEKTIPHTIRHQRETCVASKKMVFQFWSASGFTEDAQMNFDSQMVSLDGVEYLSTFSGPDEIKARVSVLKEGSIMKVLNEHYFKHPLQSSKK